MPVQFTPQPSSYRDPSGFLFHHDGILYRQVNKSFQEDFELFVSGGLYEDLVSKKLLVRHETIEANLTGSHDWYKTLKPELIPFISYPYEWCFDMWKDAALTTLEAAREAMSKGMMLKDASAYNVQWHRGRMMFLDTLSFERYHPEEPWIAYRQFCEQFLAPLALMHYLQWPLSPLLVAYPEGLPLPLVKKLLPFRSRFNLHTYLHLHLHGSAAQKNTLAPKARSSFSAKKLSDLLRSLETAVQSFSFERRSGVWSGYYEEAGQREDYFGQKEAIIDRWARGLPVHFAVDIGANEGHFSKLLAGQNKYVVSADFDHYAVNRLYQHIRKENIPNIHPILLDLSHPSPALGLNLEERASFTGRAPKGLVVALALIHHLAIGRNIPFNRIARMMRDLGPWLIIEYVPREDEKVEQMLRDKKDIYDWYRPENFLQAFAEHYAVRAEERIGQSGRTLYLMEAYEK